MILNFLGKVGKHMDPLAKKMCIACTGSFVYTCGPFTKAVKLIHGPQVKKAFLNLTELP
jgi:hypothetical protein